MSQLLAPELTLVDQIPLGRRLREIMKEKGSKYSLTAMSSRLGISRETLRVMLSGEREIYWFELEKIALDLKLPAERILQQDILPIHQEIDHLIISLKDLERALRLSKERAAPAIGPSEKANILNIIGRIYLVKRDIDEAEKCFTEMHELVKTICEKEQDDELLYRALRNLMYIYAHRKKPLLIHEIAQAAESIFTANSRRLTVMYFSLSNAMELPKEVAEAKKYAYRALEQVQIAGRDELIGRAFLHAAFYEFSDRQYVKAKELLTQALQYQLNSKTRIEVLKDLAKVHLKLREYSNAKQLILTTLQDDAIENEQDLKARLLILLSRAANTYHYAESVAGSLQNKQSVRHLALRFLYAYYKRLRLCGSDKCRKRVPGSKRRKGFPLDRFL